MGVSVEKIPGLDETFLLVIDKLLKLNFTLCLVAIILSE